MKTYGTLEFITDRWVIDKTPPHVSLRIKEVFREAGARVKPPFSFKVTGELEADLNWFIIRYPLKVSEEDRKRLESGAKKHKEKVEITEKFYSPQHEPEGRALKDGLELKAYQAIARDLFWHVDSMIDADEMGLGKTVTAVAAVLKAKYQPAIAIVQPHNVRQWAREIKKFTNLKICIIPPGRPKELPVADIYIGKYTTVHKWVEFIALTSPKTLILDEIQEIRRDESKKHQGVVELSKITPYRLGLSGTPIYNYGFETWNIYQAIRPEIFPSRDEFMRAWCSGQRISNPKALGSYLQEQRCYIRRTNEEVKTEVPPLNKIIHVVDYDEKAIKDMEKRAKTLARGIFEGSYIERGQAAQQLSVLVRKQTGVAKAKGVADYVRVILESGEKVVLVGWHRAVYDVWLKELAEFKPVLYTGSESESQKRKSVLDFTEGDAQLFIMSLRSGVGLDGLQKSCKYVVIGELDWTAAIHEQVIFRVYRMGQEHQVTAIFLICESGSDPLVIDINAVKKSQFKGIFDPFSKEKNNTINDDSIIRSYATKLLGKNGKEK